VASNHTEYPLQKGRNKMPTQGSGLFYLHPDCMEKCKSDPSVLKKAKRQDERCSGPTLAQNRAQRAHQGNLDTHSGFAVRFQ